MSLYRAIRTASVLLAMAASSSALAQMPVLQGVTGVQIQYKEPTNPAHKWIYDG